MLHEVRNSNERANTKSITKALQNIMRHMRYLHSCDDANPKKRVIETINETDNDIARSCARKYTRARSSWFANNTRLCNLFDFREKWAFTPLTLVQRSENVRANLTSQPSPPNVEGGKSENKIRV